jgi:hypothetical protein
MIDVEAEQVITLSEATRHPAYRNPRTRKPAHISSVYRHASYGARAINGARI